MKNYLTDFAKGVIAGFIVAAIIFSCVAGFWYFRNKDKELIEYAERQIEIEALREDYATRDYTDFLEVPDVRRAADGAAAEFDRKRDEAVQRFRNRFTD
jgi:AcrR family transcriptional regulator